MEEKFLKVVTAYHKRVITDLRNYCFEGKEIGVDIFIIDFIGAKTICTMSEITNFLKLEFASTATKRIDRLVDFGFVSRNNSEKDRRVVEVRLTESGKRLFNNFLQNRLFVMRVAMEHFEEAELNTFMSFIERLLVIGENMEFMKE